MGKNVKVYFRRWFTEIRLMNIAIDDFLKGPSYFVDLDIQKKNQDIREIAKNKPGFLKGAFVYPFTSIYHLFKLIFNYHRVKKEYQKEYGYLTSVQYWEGVFKQ